MANATSRNFRVAYLLQSAAGTVPVAAGQLLTVTDAQHTPTYQTVTADDIGLGEVPDVVRVGADGSITLKLEWAYGVCDDFLAGLYFQSAWSSNVLKVGSTKQLFAVEFQHLDIGKYFMYLDCVVTNIKFTLAKKSKLTAEVTLMPGIIPTASASATAFTGTATAAISNPKFSPVSSIQLAQEGGSGSMLTTGLTAFSMELSRAVVKADQVGSLNLSDIDGDIFESKGSVSLYLPNTALFDKMAADTRTSFAITIGGASSKKYAFLHTTAALLSGGPDAASKAKFFVQSYNWQALYDATNSTTKITRTP